MKGQGGEESDATARLANGRALPDLLFATVLDKLRANIGDGADEIVTLIRSAGQTLHEISRPDKPWEEVAGAATGKAGVVLVGGYDVVPAVRTDVVPTAVRRAFAANNDADNFVVWSDQSYGDIDADGIPDKPVSRIPDGGSYDLVRKALVGSTASPTASRFGLRNVKRPFADDVFQPLAGSEAMLVSEPTTTADVVPERLDAERIYLMLHGSDEDTSRFWGQAPTGPLEALHTSCIPDLGGGIVFAGSCYGALLATQPAVSSPAAPTPIRYGDSLALEFLAKGARAFIGCTGTHYSPAAPPYNWGSPDLHRRFWEKIANGAAPAEALFHAKVDYMASLPYVPDADLFAILLKPWGQFTCLGLGW